MTIRNVPTVFICWALLTSLTLFNSKSLAQSNVFAQSSLNDACQGQHAIKSAFEDAEHLHLTRGLQRDQRSFGLHLRSISVNGATVAMAIPWRQMQVPAGNVHQELLKTGRWSIHETSVVEAIFSQHCGTGGPLLVLDVGSNIGYYSLIAAAFGCKVMAFDGNPEALAYLRMSVALNGYSDRIQIFHALVSNMTNINYNGWQATASNTDSPVSAAAANPLGSPKTVRLDDAVQQKVLYAKIDAEGWEPSVFSSAVGVLATDQLRPLYVFFEMTYFLEKKYIYEYVDVTRLLKVNGYTCHSVHTRQALLLAENKEEFATMLQAAYSGCHAWEHINCGDEFLCTHASASFKPFAH